MPERARPPFRADYVPSRLRPAFLREARKAQERNAIAIEELTRIEEGARYLPLDLLALSPQCGLSSTDISNKITLAAEIAKLRLVVEVAREVWG